MSMLRGVVGRSLWVALSMNLVVIVAHAQAPLRLKTGALEKMEPDGSQTGTRAAKATRRRNPGRRHWVIQFPASPEPAQLEELRRRGVNILGYVPDFGLSVSAEARTNFEGLGLSAVGTVAAASKVSAEVKGAAGDADQQFVLVEFYPDVDMNDARAMILEQQMHLLESPDLLEHDLLASGTSHQISALGLWEEVAYVFPASNELIQGLPLHACAGALTDQGPVGQSVLRVGDGWGGPGRNGADLNYAFVNTTPKIQDETVKAEIARAFAEWAKHAKLNFTQIADPSAERTIAVLFGSRNHGDAFPFDGPGGILAHTFYPYPANPEPVAGDMHLDADENWNVGADVDLFSVALHEAGHALGLGHSDKPGAVMYPYYRQSSGLTAEDIGAILMMYAAQDDSPAVPKPLTLTVDDTNFTTGEPSITLHGSASGGAGSIAVSWTSNRGFSGSAAGLPNWTAGPLALGIGINTVTVVAKDSQQTQVARVLTIVRQATAPAIPTIPTAPTAPAVLPQINITSPAAGGSYTALSASISLSGTASDTAGIARVMWSSSRGGYGPATGTTVWGTGPIQLQTGVNIITITAITQSGANVSRALEVSFAPAAANAGPPSLTLLSPSTTSLSTSANSLSMNGTAQGGGGITVVTWTNSTGIAGTATGTSTWSIAEIPLLVGTNSITVRATNAAGLTSWRSVVVTRR